MAGVVSVAVPVLNGGSRLDEVLAAVSAQSVDAEVELVICDSGSDDGSVEVARRHGAEVIEIDRRDFGHGRTRNLLMDRTQGDHVAFLTQDAVPADDRWLEQLTGAFALAPDVALSFGPYRPRPDASPIVARELSQWFGSLAPTGEVRVDRLPADRLSQPARELYGAPGYFTDANGCVARAAWEEVPFRDVAYAEDQMLAVDMLRSGRAKAFVPPAAVVHSHDYSPWEWLRRSFDEARAVVEVYGWTPGGEPQAAARNLWGTVGADWRATGRSPRALLASSVHHGARTAGGLIGAHTDRLPDWLVAQLSLEGRR